MILCVKLSSTKSLWFETATCSNLFASLRHQCTKNRLWDCIMFMAETAMCSNLLASEATPCSNLQAWDTNALCETALCLLPVRQATYSDLFIAHSRETSNMLQLAYICETALCCSVLMAVNWQDALVYLCQGRI